MDTLQYRISRDRDKLDVKSIKSLLEQSYWAQNRSEGTIAKSIQNSLCYGVYLEDHLVGFGRVLTDYSTVFWICDIIIDSRHRGKGLGKMLMDSIMSTKELEGLLGILATRDAHSLYEKYGFNKDPNKCMLKKRTE